MPLFTAVRPAPFTGHHRPARFLIPSLVRQALDPETDIIEVADDRPRRDFLYVTDLAKLLAATVEDPCSGTYNAGSGTSTSIREVVDILSSLAPRPKALVSRGEVRRREVLDVFADNGGAMRDFHWGALTALPAGLRHMVEHASAIGGAAE